ncbi:hypothetical protein VNO80_26069 [Phaseolus coccineus]|uniref:Peptidase S26 domain-containing protein n=1 Tax=Phaseolus coccineus TaxID=3886 RepID=A0AAN9LWE0_PHACN
MKLGNFVTIMKSMCYVHVVNTYLIQPAATSGPSMLPTIDMTTSWFLIEKISTRWGNVDRRDIVLLRDPQNPRLMLVKRVVGLEGDRITYKYNHETNKLKGGGFTYVTKRKTDELEGDGLTYSSNPETNYLVGDNSSHISYPENLKPESVVVPKGSVWVEGDYMYNSRDSRKFGPVPCDLILGKLFWRIYPFKYFGPFWHK